MTVQNLRGERVLARGSFLVAGDGAHSLIRWVSLWFWQLPGSKGRCLQPSQAEVCFRCLRSSLGRPGHWYWQPGQVRLLSTMLHACLAAPRSLKQGGAAIVRRCA